MSELGERALAKVRYVPTTNSGAAKRLSDQVYYEVYPYLTRPAIRDNARPSRIKNALRRVVGRDFDRG